MGATEEGPVRLYAMTNDLAATVFADGREGVNGALEAVESMRSSSGGYLERFIVVVAADLAKSHHFTP